MIDRLCLAPLAFALLLSPVTPAGAATLDIEYSVSIRGFPVGSARLKADTADELYSIAFTARVAGLARLFSDAEVTADAAGSVAAERLYPVEYSHIWVEDGETESVAMRFAGNAVTDIALDPPRNRPERYEPITEAHKAGVTDPVSAFLTPAADDPTPDLCTRILPLIDGKYRFDIELAFARAETFATRDQSFSGPAVVCSMRYRQIAGHRIGRPRGGFMEDSADNEVWLAPAANGFAAPVRVQFRSRAGRIVLQATEIHAD